jgi:tRNA-splicing ligase RtcB
MYNTSMIAPCIYRIPKEGNMLVPAIIIASADLICSEDLHDAIEQVKNVATLPGIVGHSIAMPDIHWGYGFPIGGVAATDAEKGVISPGGVGYDINCGVRLAVAPIVYASINDKQKQALIEKIYKLIPSGVGHGHRGKAGLTVEEYSELLVLGSSWAVKEGYGLREDIERTESYGKIAGADPTLLSQVALNRGKNQLGTIGSGNHFVEIGEIEELYDEGTAKIFGVEKGLTYVLIHSGSRGLGHQVCQDALDLFVSKGFDTGLVDRQLVCAPLQSKEGVNYMAQMAAAANFAFNNRQKILHEVRQAFTEVFQLPYGQLKLVYDVCHNIAKMEKHRIDGKEKLVCVHRKGATRALGPGSEELCKDYKHTGQPVLVPGDMGRASFLMAGLGNPLTFCSACHGAGRARSRIKSLKAWQGKDVIEVMRSSGVIVKASSDRTIAEEMPDAYKDVNRVVDAVEQAMLARKIARLLPRLVLKG